MRPSSKFGPHLPKYKTKGFWEDKESEPTIKAVSRALSNQRKARWRVITKSCEWDETSKYKINNGAQEPNHLAIQKK